MLPAQRSWRFFGSETLPPRRIVVTLAAAALFVVANVSPVGAAKPKPLPKPVCTIGQPTISGNQVSLVGSCRVGKKTVPSSWHWSVTGETDASSAPLPVQPTCGTGAIVPVPIQGGYKLNLAVKLSTPKVTKPKISAHQSVTKSAAVTALLGGYTAVGTQQPHITPFLGDGIPFCDTAIGQFRTNVPLTVSGRTVHAPSAYECGPSSIMNSCSHWQPLPPQPPTDMVPGMDGTVETTNLTFYGGKVVCTDSSGNPNGYWAIPQIILDFGTGAGQPDSCELVMTGVTSFTIPPEWKNLNIVYTHLLSFGPSGLLPDNPSRTESWVFYSGPQGSLDPCQAYNLPAWKAGRP